ncbi:MAG: TonB-dependent receptor [Proteobacteria bacterium]|nr:TonB-dependent receptor [Pseudomonadota bacterium]
MNSKIARTIAAILGSAAVAAAATAADAPGGPPAPQASSTSASSGDALAEVVVTAQRRTENMQNVPIAMQAMTEQSLRQLNVATLDDYVKYLPNVTTANNGPGQNEIFMRGLSAGSQPSQGSASTGLWPNVAIYLDNQSGQLPNRNLDVYAADLNRIEILEGPQGTLYGAGAEAGVIRYITNEPKLDKTEASITGGYGVTAHGDPNSNLTAVLNLPLIADRLAVRGVIYNDRRGGYIDNVPATFTRSASDIGIHYANYATSCPSGVPTNGICPGGNINPVTGKQVPTSFGVPPGSPTVNNFTIAGRAINPVTYQGVRAEALYKFNEDWDALITQSYQQMDSKGVFYQQPNASDGTPLNPLEVTVFNPSFNKDRFESTAWTVNGKFGDLKAVYTGGYLVRTVEQVGDYTNYARGFYADYYQCYGPTAYDPGLKPTCFSPSATWHSDERNTHQQHEIRLSTPDDWRLRVIGGVFWEANKLWDQTDWRYRTVPSCTATLTTGCFAPIGTVPGTTVVNPGLQTPNSSFYQDTMRETKQTAFFISFDYDLIPKVLTLTAGTRRFRFDNSSVGSVSGSFGCFEGGAPPTGCLNYARPGASPPFFSYSLDAQNLRDTESGFKSRANLTWHITPDTMVYYTFSQGFRPGGFNQNGGSAHAPGPDGINQYLVPSSYQSDKLTNNEIGWKTEFLEHRLQWNGAVYREDWKNVQVAFFNPGLVGNVFYNTNGQDFRIKGIETSLVWRVLTGLTLQGASSWNSSEQTNSPQLLANNPASGNFGHPLLVQSPTGAWVPAGNLFGPPGAPSANSPPLQFSLRARYDWAIGDYGAFVQAGATHSGHSFTQAGANPTLEQAGSVNTSRLRFENPAYTTYDASLGVTKDAWTVSVFGENLSNSNASTFISTDQFIVAQTPLRPRVIGVTANYRF